MGFKKEDGMFVLGIALMILALSIPSFNARIDNDVLKILVQACITLMAFGFLGYETTSDIKLDWYLTKKWIIGTDLLEIACLSVICVISYQSDSITNIEKLASMDDKTNIAAIILFSAMLFRKFFMRQKFIRNGI